VEPAVTQNCVASVTNKQKLYREIQYEYIFTTESVEWTEVYLAGVASGKVTSAKNWKYNGVALFDRIKLYEKWISCIIQKSCKKPKIFWEYVQANQFKKATIGNRKSSSSTIQENFSIVTLFFVIKILAAL
jgi:hypothetical protein